MRSFFTTALRSVSLLALGAVVGIWSAPHAKSLASFVGIKESQDIARSIPDPRCIPQNPQEDNAPLFINCAGFLE